MTTFLHIIREQTTDKQRQSIILKKSPLQIHSFVFTLLFSPTHFHPPIFTQWVGEKNCYTMRIKMPFSPTLSTRPWQTSYDRVKQRIHQMRRDKPETQEYMYFNAFNLTVTKIGEICIFTHHKMIQLRVPAALPMVKTDSWGCVQFV